MVELGMKTRVLLQVEGAVFLVVSVFLYRSFGGGWGMFAALFLVPDVSMIGYVVNARVGAAVYNAVHTYAGPVLLAVYSAATEHRGVLLIALIWIAHIGMDRMLGFGLKYATGFKDTHLNRV
jgi:Domain of unknown function (DUF4260)